VTPALSETHYFHTGIETFDVRPRGFELGTDVPPHQETEHLRRELTTQPGFGISYHNGPVLTAGVTAYYIWYGAWNTSSQTILSNFARSLGGSPWFNIESTYSNSASVHIPNTLAFGGAYQYPLSYPTGAATYAKSLSDNDIFTIVVNTLGGNHLPLSAKAVYMVLTSPDVTESSGFCSSYCGWHTYGTYVSTNIKFAFVGNPETLCPNSCSAQSTSPNGDLGADAMVSVIAHELAEATSDPNLNAWYDSAGMENADKCAWTFGTVLPCPAGVCSSGGLYNIGLGGHKYLIQQNWVNARSSSGANGFCAMSH